MKNNTEKIKAPIISINRLRFLVDGQGITTLVSFQGCPLNCRMCLNPFTIAAENKNARHLTPEELYQKVRIDELYFLATGGGITFGGGEPLLHPDFIRSFREICGEAWHICAETSLAVPWENVKSAADAVDLFYFDCKDTNPEIYKSYTGRENTTAINNIKMLAQLIPAEKIVVRIPLIPGFNTEDDRQKSMQFFSGLGLTQFDLFTYEIRNNDKAP